MINKFFIVFIGGGLGAGLRYLLNILFIERFGYWTTFGINMLGSLILGIVSICLLHSTHALSPSIKIFTITGILGGFTTLGAFNLELILLLRAHDFLQAFIYCGSTIFGGVGMVVLGIYLGHFLI